MDAIVTGTYGSIAAQWFMDLVPRLLIVWACGFAGNVVWFPKIGCEMSWHKVKVLYVMTFSSKFIICINWKAVSIMWLFNRRQVICFKKLTDFWHESSASPSIYLQYTWFWLAFDWILTDFILNYAQKNCVRYSYKYNLATKS